MQNNKISVEDSRAIELLRFPLIVCVVFIHSFGRPVDVSVIDWTALSPYDVYDIIRVFFSRIITHSAVPCFYFISGYLFFHGIQKFDRSVWQRKMKSRIRTLLVPYLLWNAIFILAILGKDLLKFALGMEPFDNIISWYNDNGGIVGLLWNCNVWGEDAVDWLGNALRSSGPIDLPLWFLRDLMITTLLTPFIHWFIRRCGLWFIALLGLAFVSKVWPVIDGFSITALFFFSLGAYMGDRKISLSAFKPYSTTVYITTAILALVATYLGGPDTLVGNIVFPFFRIAGMVALICLALISQQKGRMASPVLTRSVFFVYALHGLYIVSYYCGGMISGLASGHGAAIETIVYFIVPFIKIGVCLALFVFMEHFMPRVLAVLTGNRG